MGIVANFAFTKTENIFRLKIEPIIDALLGHQEYYLFLSVILVILILTLIRLITKHFRSVNNKNTQKPKDGYKNFKGDTWFPDGRIWVKDKKKWEDPDYKK